MSRSKPVSSLPISKGGRGIKSSDRRKVITTGIRTSEYEELKAIAEVNGVAPNAVIAFFLRHSLQQYRDGKLKIPTVTTRKIQMP